MADFSAGSLLMTWDDLSGALRTAQFLEQENERLIRPSRCVAKAHLAGSVRGDVGIGRMSVENGFDLASRRDDELRMQETSVPGRAAAGRADGHFDLLGQLRRDLLDRPGQLQVRDRAGWVHGDPTELPPDRQPRKQVATPRDRVDD